jgi:broad specificity phosphatase PhoE
MLIKSINRTSSATLSRAEPLRCPHRGAAVLFVRHPETLKNVKQGFGGGSNDNDETDRGRQDARALLKEISAMTDFLPRCCSISIRCSPELRASALATAIATDIKTASSADQRLMPRNNGCLGGLTAREVAERNPAYLSNILLHRSGLLDGYAVNFPGEDIMHFEKRIASSLSDIETSGHSVTIVVSHKSAIGAALINYARRFHGYPTAFYGYVELQTASVSLVSPQHESIVYVNRLYNHLELSKIFKQQTSRAIDPAQPEWES